jgi:hypothetical protein
MTCGDLYALPRYALSSALQSAPNDWGGLLIFGPEGKLWFAKACILGEELRSIRSNPGHSLRAGFDSCAYVTTEDQAGAEQLVNQIVDDCEPYGQFPNVNQQLQG